MKYESVNILVKDSIALITIDKPKVLNAIDEASLAELQAAVEESIADDEVRVLVITGGGKKAFISGGDIAAELAMDGMSSYRWSINGHKLASTIEQSPKPVIAAVNGYALGGGCEIAIACDFRIASDNAKFGTPEIKLGVICGFGGNLRLPRLVGKTKAKEMLLLGNMVDAEEAYRIGLVNKVVPQDELLDAVYAFAGELASKSLVALEFAKKAIDWGYETDFQTAILHESELFGLVSGTDDKVEGMQAFLEKRPPKFTDK
jgi:enoyl-CoA hydratase